MTIVALVTGVDENAGLFFYKIIDPGVSSENFQTGDLNAVSNPPLQVGSIISFTIDGSDRTPNILITSNP